MFGGTKFDPDTEIPDLSGKTILVTGGRIQDPIGLLVQRAVH